jgi:ammonium transporter Rh
MVFVRGNGFNATTGTYLAVAATLPLYMLAKSLLAGESAALSIVSLLLAEFAAAAALIAMGAVLGKLKSWQCALLGLVVVPFYMLNEWLVTEGGLGVTAGFTDPAGSVGIHAFGAYFGMGLTLALQNARLRQAPVASDYTSDRFSMLGSMALWIFWPSLCSAIVAPGEITATAVNTVLALCGATLCAYFMSLLTRKGKAAITDIANASLAGGVAIGSTCNSAKPWQAFVIGVAAGAVCVLGYAFLQPLLEKKLKLADTCGVHNLHGMPGLFGGVAAVFVAPCAAGAQLTGVAVTLAVALAGGLLSGALIKLTGLRKRPCDDTEEFSMEEGCAQP